MLHFASERWVNQTFPNTKLSLVVDFIVLVLGVYRDCYCVDAGGTAKAKVLS